MNVFKFYIRKAHKSCFAPNYPEAVGTLAYDATDIIVTNV